MLAFQQLSHQSESSLAISGDLQRNNKIVAVSARARHSHHFIHVPFVGNVASRPSLDLIGELTTEFCSSPAW